MLIKKNSINFYQKQHEIKSFFFLLIQQIKQETLWRQKHKKKKIKLGHMALSRFRSDKKRSVFSSPLYMKQNVGLKK